MYILSLICVLRIDVSALYLTNMLKLDFYGASSLKMQQSRGRHVVPLGHISLILRRPVIPEFKNCIVSLPYTHFSPDNFV